MDCAGSGGVRPRGSVACSVGSIGEIGQGETRAGDTHATDYDKRTFVTGDRIKISKSGGAAESALYQRKAEGGWGLAGRTNSADHYRIRVFCGFLSGGIQRYPCRSKHANQFLEKQPVDGGRSIERK